MSKFRTEESSILKCRPPGPSTAIAPNEREKIFRKNLYPCPRFSVAKRAICAQKVHCQRSLIDVLEFRDFEIKEGAMKNGTLGNGFQTSRLLGNQRVSLPKNSSSRLPQRRQAVSPQAVADFVKEKTSVGSNGNGRIHLEVDESSLETDIVRKANYVVGSEDLEPFSAYRATALSVREHLIEAFNKTQKYWK